MKYDGLIGAIIEHSRPEVKASAIRVADGIVGKGWVRGWAEGCGYALMPREDHGLIDDGMVQSLIDEIHKGLPVWEMSPADKLIARGYAEGHAASHAWATARAAGDARGGAEILLRQLEYRFGPLSDRARAQVLDTGLPHFDALAKRLLEAESLAGALAEPHG